MTTDRPNRVKIGPFTYRIQWRERVFGLNEYGQEDAEQEALSARVDHFDLVIHVCNSMALPVQRKSLLHEIIHACNWVTGHDDSANEEEFVRSLAFPLLDVLRTNPKITAFLLERD